MKYIPSLLEIIAGAILLKFGLEDELTIFVIVGALMTLVGVIGIIYSLFSKEEKVISQPTPIESKTKTEANATVQKTATAPSARPASSATSTTTPEQQTSIGGVSRDVEDSRIQEIVTLQHTSYRKDKRTPSLCQTS